MPAAEVLEATLGVVIAPVVPEAMAVGATAALRLLLVLLVLPIPAEVAAAQEVILPRLMLGPVLGMAAQAGQV